MWRKICVVTDAWQKTCHWCDEWQNVTDVMKDMRCHCMLYHCCLLKDTCRQWCDERHVLQQLSSIQLKMVSMLSEKHACAPRHPVSQPFPGRWLWNSSVGLTIALSRPFKGDRRVFLCPCLSPPADRWCRVLGFVSAGSVSSSSTFQISRDTRTCYRCDVRKSLFFTPRQPGTDVTKNMCCHWKTCCSCCLTKDSFCHCYDEGNVAGVTKDICYHRCYEMTGVVTVWRKRHMVTLMFRRTCVVIDVMRRQVLSLVWRKRHMFSLMCRRTCVVTDVRRRHVSSLVRMKDIRCHRGDERHVLLLHASRISRQKG